MSQKELELEGMENVQDQLNQLDLDVPDDLGLAVRGKTPALGELRRNNDIPVLRDKIAEEFEEI